MSNREQQQPIGRVVGARKSRDGQALTAADRVLMTEMARYRTRAPKGIFIYRNHADMEADRLRWLVQAMLEKVRQR